MVTGLAGTKATSQVDAAPTILSGRSISTPLKGTPRATASDRASSTPTPSSSPVLESWAAMKAGWLWKATLSLPVGATGVRGGAFVHVPRAPGSGYTSFSPGSEDSKPADRRA
jgi:hypothetical protein